MGAGKGNFWTHFLAAGQSVSSRDHRREGVSERWVSTPLQHRPAGVTNAGRTPPPLPALPRRSREPRVLHPCRAPRGGPGAYQRSLVARLGVDDAVPAVCQRAKKPMKINVACRAGLPRQAIDISAIRHSCRAYHPCGTGSLCGWTGLNCPARSPAAPSTRSR
jgi:hypothetical protein